MKTCPSDMSAIGLLRALVEQVERSNAVDDHGHELKHLKALQDARDLLDGQTILRRVRRRLLDDFYATVDDSLEEKSLHDALRLVERRMIRR
jgi:hypothetical protein